MSNNNNSALIALQSRAESAHVYEAFLAGADAAMLRAEAEKSYMELIDACEAASNMRLSRKLPILPEREEELRLWIARIQAETDYQWRVAGHH